MILTRLISAFVTFCVIASTGVTASLRVDAGSGQFVTICAGGQSVTVELDHTGAPLDPCHHCPDCISVAILAPASVAPGPTLAEVKLTRAHLVPSQTSTPVLTASARAPPLTV